LARAENPPAEPAFAGMPQVFVTVFWGCDGNSTPRFGLIAFAVSAWTAGTIGFAG
jgi:hypothetical protein